MRCFEPERGRTGQEIQCKTLVSSGNEMVGPFHGEKMRHGTRGTARFLFFVLHVVFVRQPLRLRSAPSFRHRHFATMFASSLARTAARRAATATPMRLGALRAMSSENATFDLTGSFEVRHVRSHSKERCADSKAERRKTHGCGSLFDGMLPLRWDISCQNMLLFY